MTTLLTQPRTTFTKQGKHGMSSDDDDSDASVPVLSFGQRKRRKTISSPPKPPSPKLESSDDDEPVASSHVRRRKGVPQSDVVARQRCFDYLLTAIDAVWAEYCDSTSHAEEQMYMPCSPVSEEEKEIPHRESVSEQPQSMRLMRFKARLLNAKYVMTDLAPSSEPDASSQFWKRWDTLKYATVEAVEGEDDDCDTVLEDLEAGRHWV